MPRSLALEDRELREAVRMKELGASYLEVAEEFDISREGGKMPDLIKKGGNLKNFRDSIYRLNGGMVL